VIVAGGHTTEAIEQTVRFQKSALQLYKVTLTPNSSSEGFRRSFTKAEQVGVHQSARITKK
jgi:hypothetical protein